MIFYQLEAVKDVYYNNYKNAGIACAIKNAGVGVTDPMGSEKKNPVSHLAYGYATLAYGAKGVGEIPLIPTSPAVQNAYYKRDGIFRTKLPLKDTAYSKH